MPGTTDPAIDRLNRVYVTMICRPHLSVDLRDLVDRLYRWRDFDGLLALVQSPVGIDAVGF